MRFRTFVPIAVVLGLLIGVGAYVASTEAKDAEGCQGLSDYRVAMFKIGRDYLKANEEDGITPGKDPFLYSSDDYTNAADNILQFNRDLKAIEPPEWAEPWHQLEIDGTAIGEQAFRAIASDGIMMMIGFGDMIDANQAALDSAVISVSQTCSDFTEFQHDWDAMDGEIDGTPVATPTD